MCPTYRNLTNLRPLLEGKIVEPKQSVYSLSYHDEDTVGLKLVDEKPYFNPLLLSERIVRPTNIEVPKRDNLGKLVNKYSIHFYIEKGSVKILYNAIENNPALLLYEGAKWNSRHFERNIERICVGSDVDFVMYLIIEKLT